MQNAVEFLSQARHIDVRINSKLEELSSLKALAEKVTTTYQKDMVDGSRDVHKREEIICKEKQMELLEAGKDQGMIDEIGEAILGLREERQCILTEAAKNTELKERVNELAAFLGEQTEALTDYSETLVRRLIEKITVYDEKLTVEFKSGLIIDVDA